MTKIDEKEDSMKKSVKIASFIVIILISFAFSFNAYAKCTYSKYMKVTSVSTGVYGTYVYSGKAFPSGRTSARILHTTNGHSRMLAEILYAKSTDKYMAFCIDDNNGSIVQTLLYDP